MNTYFKRLRKQLPHRYTTAISNTVPGLTPRQVKAVFNGETQNINTVEAVVKAAIKMSKKSSHIVRQMKNATTKRKTTKKAA
jgi:hypothetical protein